MVIATYHTIRPVAESLAMIKANVNKMTMSNNDNDKKMAAIFLDMHATLEKMIVATTAKPPTAAAMPSAEVATPSTAAAELPPATAAAAADRKSVV